MTKEEQEAYDIAERGVLGAVYDMRKALNMIESWILYGRMEKSKQGKCAIITEETVYISHDHGHSRPSNGDMADDDDLCTRHPMTGEPL